MGRKILMVIVLLLAIYGGVVTAFLWNQCHTRGIRIAPVTVTVYDGNNPWSAGH